jgi:(R,R)-butanediol dehydrogenase / meso-butanediol dehydrogenase / diacetyl reductase
MRALVLEGWGQVATRQRTEPVATPGQTLIDVDYVGLCGTDLHIIAGDHPRAALPLVLGHEIVGRAVDGPAAGRSVVVNPLRSCGSCTACRHGHAHVCEQLRLVGIDVDGGLAERIGVADDAVHVVPAGLPRDVAALAEPTAVGVHALARAELSLGERVLVVGAGPVGLLIALLARHAGARDVVVAERAAQRQEHARALGFEVLPADVPDPAVALRERGDGDLPDVVFDCAAAPAVARLVTRVVRPRGRIVVVGSYGAPPTLDLQAVTFRELDVRGTRVYTPAEIDTALALLQDLADSCRQLITAIHPIEAATGAIAALEQGQEMKVLIAVGADAGSHS